VTTTIYENKGKEKLVPRKTRNITVHTPQKKEKKA
jgi:hypothetical protein